MSVSLNKASDLLVIDLINVANSTSLTDGQVTIGTPTALSSDPDNYNTSAPAHAIKGSGYIGGVTVKYNRLDIGLLFKNIAVNVNALSATTTTGLLQTLNEKYGLGLSAADVVDNPISTATTPITHTIQIAANSLAYTGSVTTTIGEDPEVGERLNTVILITNLNGLLYPNSDTTKGQAREYSWNINGSSISTWLSARVTGETIADTALAIELNKVTPDIWVFDDAAADYNTSGAEVLYAGPNDATRDTNQTYSRIVQFKLSETLCTNLGGVLTLGYN